MLLIIYLFLQLIHFPVFVTASSSSSTLTQYGSDGSKALSSGGEQDDSTQTQFGDDDSGPNNSDATKYGGDYSHTLPIASNSLGPYSSQSLGSASSLTIDSDASGPAKNSLALSNSNSLGSAGVVAPDSDTSIIAVQNSLALSNSDSLGSVELSAEKSGADINSLALSNSQSLGSAGSLTSDPDDNSLVDNTLTPNNSQSLGSTGYQSSSSDSSKPAHNSLALSSSKSLGSAGAVAALDESIAAGTVSNSLAASNSMEISVENVPDSHSLGSTFYVSETNSSEERHAPVSNSLKSSSSQSLQNKNHINSMSLGSPQHHSNRQSSGLSAGNSLSLGSTEVKGGYDASNDHTKRRYDYRRAWPYFPMTARIDQNRANLIENFGNTRTLGTFNADYDWFHLPKVYQFPY